MRLIAKSYLVESSTLALNNERMRKNAKLPKLIGRRIKKLRKDTDFSQEDLAHKVGISRVYMGYIEQGRYAPSLSVLGKIAKNLKVSIKELLG